LARLGRVEGVMGEVELALEMARQMLRKFGVSSIEAQAVALDYRRAAGSPEAEPVSTRILDVQVAPDSRAAGKRLADLGLGQGALVMAVSRGSKLLVPDGTTELQPGDSLLVITDQDGLARLRESF
jgi:K+/H+ antiporter YhaU regulatory subunit KhtT